MTRMKLAAMGNSTGIALPREIREHLNVEKGDEVFITRAGPGEITVSAYDPEFAEEMAIVQKASRKYRNALHELAK